MLFKVWELNQSKCPEGGSIVTFQSAQLSLMLKKSLQINYKKICIAPHGNTAIIMKGEIKWLDSF